LRTRLAALLPAARADLVAAPDGGDLKASFDAGRAAVLLDADPDLARVFFEAAGSAGVEHVVILSSALVYGAWANNPVPLTEEAPMRPNPELGWAVGAAEVERLAAEWQEDHPGATVAVLRPTTAVADGTASWLARGLQAARRLRSAEDEPQGQYVHLDDVASATAVAVERRLDGVFNVSPDGWIAGQELRALAGGPRIRLPERLATRLASLRWRLGLADSPPGVLPYAIHPWVVANDRLRATGWQPQHTNEEAFVAGHRAGPLATLSPHKRQALALSVAGVGLAGLVTGAVVLIRRWVISRPG
jgi:nucleoside-diphosphate-sugar epimerase